MPPGQLHRGPPPCCSPSPSPAPSSHRPCTGGPVVLQLLRGACDTEACRPGCRAETWGAPALPPPHSPCTGWGCSCFLLGPDWLCAGCGRPLCRLLRLLTASPCTTPSSPALSQTPPLGPEARTLHHSVGPSRDGQCRAPPRVPCSVRG